MWLPNVVRSPGCDPRRHEEFRNGLEVKIYIWEVLFWSPEKFRVLSVTYQEHREGPGGPQSGATSPGGLHGPSVGGDHPQVGWCAPHQGPRRMGEWEGANPRSRWALRPTLVAPPSPPSWPPP